MDSRVNHTASSVQRPLNFRPNVTVGNETMPRVELASNMLWASIELMKNMAMGHDVDSLAKFFATLTVHDCSLLSRAMNSAAALGQSTIQIAANIPSAAVEGYRPQNWDTDTVTASFRAAFDPISHHRRAIIANARQASLYGMHPEEFHARCASRNLHIPMPDEDFVALLIYSSVDEQFRREAIGEIFTRIFAGGGGCGTAMLVHVQRCAAMDALGRISEVCQGYSMDMAV